MDAGFQKFVKDEERDALTAETTRVKAWLEDDVDFSTTIDKFKEKQEAVDSLLKPVYERIKEEKVIISICYRPSFSCFLSSFYFLYKVLAFI